MRLYLSSFRLGDHAEELCAMAGSHARVAVIANGLDAENEGTRRAGVERELRDLAELGLHAEELDLRRTTGVSALTAYDGVWVRGGNVFVLRKALRESGLDDVLVGLLESDTIFYAGYSAGPAVLAPSLKWLEEIDDATVVRDPLWTGLAVLDRPFIPHVESPGHPETADCDAASARLSREGVTHWALRDGEVLVVGGSTYSVVGRLG